MDDSFHTLWQWPEGSWARLVATPAASEVKETHNRRNLKTREAAAHLTHFKLGDGLSPEAR